MNIIDKNSWEYVLVKTSFCKLLIDLLSFEFNQNIYDNIEGFLILDFIDKQNIYLNKLYQIEYNNLKKHINIDREFDYKSLNEKRKIVLIIKSIINLFSRYIDNKNIIFYNKDTILNLLCYINTLRKDYNINLKTHKKIFQYIYNIVDNTFI
jgi:hypothetical protein